MNSSQADLVSTSSSSVNNMPDTEAASPVSSLHHALELPSPTSPVRAASHSASASPGFSIGQRIRLLSGRYCGREGIITGTEANLYVVALDGIAQPVYKRADSLALGAPRVQAAPPIRAPPSPEPIIELPPDQPPAVISSSSRAISFSDPLIASSQPVSAEIRRKRAAGSKMEWAQGQQILITHGKGAGKYCTVVGSGHGFICVLLEDGKKLQKRVFELALKETSPKKSKTSHASAVKHELGDNDMQNAAWTLLGIRSLSSSSNDSVESNPKMEEQKDDLPRTSSNQSELRIEEAVAANAVPATVYPSAFTFNASTPTSARYPSVHSAIAAVPAIALDHPSPNAPATYVYPYSAAATTTSSSHQPPRPQYRYMTSPHSQALPYAVTAATAAYVPAGYPVSWYNAAHYAPSNPIPTKS